MSSNEKRNENFLESIFGHILEISRGKCSINENTLLEDSTEKERMVLEGLLYLHEDIEQYKLDLRAAMEAEYKIKVLEEKNKELELFNHIASHDLQEPLRTISGFSKLLNKQYGKKLDDNAKEYLTYIVDSAKRMSELIQGLLSYSRLGNTRKLKQVNCQKMVEDIQKDLYASIEDKNIQLNVEELPTLYAFELELRQVFQNLISNALKFHEPTRELQIRISCQIEEQGYLFCIQDNGIGIEDIYKDKIFDLFQRLNARKDYQGTGIGLSNCRKIIEIHNGEIWVESLLGEGSSFFFRIPFLNNGKKAATKLLASSQV